MVSRKDLEIVPLEPIESVLDLEDPQYKDFELIAFQGYYREA